MKKSSRQSPLHHRSPWVRVYGPILAIVFICIAIVGTVVIVQRRLERGSAQLARDTAIYSESFDSTTYRDPSTTANWDTVSGVLRLASDPGALYRPNAATVGTDNVTNTAGAGETVFFNSLDLDSQGRPGIVYNGSVSGSQKIYFTRWNGTTWTGVDSIDVDSNPSTFEATQVSFGTDTDQAATFKFDSLDRPVITYTSDPGGSPDIMVTRWDGSNWTAMNGTPGVDTISVTGRAQMSIVVLDALDRPAVVWDDSITPPNRSAVYSQWSGTNWTKADGTVGSDVFPAISATTVLPSLDRHANGNPVIVYNNNGPVSVEVYYTEWNGSNWVQADGTTPGPVNVSQTPASFNSTGMQVELTSDGRPAISWKDDRSLINNEVFFSVWNGSTFTGASEVDVDSTPSTYEYTVLAPVSSGGGSDADLALMSNGWPGIIYLNDTTGYIEYAEWNGTAVTDASGIDADNNPLTQESTTIEASGCFQQTLAFGSDDQPWFAWDVCAGGDVFASRWVEPYLPSGVAESLSVDNVSEPISEARLICDPSTPAGTSLSFELSNDGGITWQSASCGSIVVFSGEGSDLRWRANLGRTTSDLSLSPILPGLGIEYTYGPASTAVNFERIPIDDPIDLANELSQMEFDNESADAVVLTRNTNIVDTLTVMPFARNKNAPLLVTTEDHLDSRTLAEIRRVVGPTVTNPTIYLTGGFEALQQKVADDLLAAGFGNQVRFNGEDRDQTAALIALALVQSSEPSPTKAILTENRRFADTLGIGAVASNALEGGQYPILLSERANGLLSTDTLDFLRNNPQITSLEIIGGVEALPEAVVTNIRSNLTNITDIQRTDGETRFNTNANFNAKHIPVPEILIFANGQPQGLVGAQSIAAASSGVSFFAALLGARFAANFPNAAMLIVRADELPEPISEYIISHKANITDVVFVGSELMLSQTVEDQIRGFFEFF
ncbi:MAG: cell wall-binding repeat-containing protein [Parcubacteria group bacterium]